MVLKFSPKPFTNNWKKDKWESSKFKTTYIKRKSRKIKIGKREISGYEIIGRVEINNLGNYYVVGTFRGEDIVKGSVKAFKTKVKANKFAQEYMRKH